MVLVQPFPHLARAFIRIVDMGSILSMQWPIAEERRSGLWQDLTLVIAGAIHQLRGRVSVIRGTLFHNDIMRALGYRQQLVGMLQRFWRRDRKSVEAWVDALLRRSAPPSRGVRPAWRQRATHMALHEERSNN
jgi:hypothetical protein